MQHNPPLLPNGPKILPEGPIGPVSLPERVTELNRKLRHNNATEVLAAALDEVPNLALVSSFGSESVVLLHLASWVQKDMPILFLGTEFLSPETRTYQQELTRCLGLLSKNIAQQDPQNTLHPSIGCMPSTAPVKQGEAPRAGRWQKTKKDECRIHFTNDQLHRTGAYQ